MLLNAGTCGFQSVCVVQAKGDNAAMYVSTEGSSLGVEASSPATEASVPPHLSTVEAGGPAASQQQSPAASQVEDSPLSEATDFRAGGTGVADASEVLRSHSESGNFSTEGAPALHGNTLPKLHWTSQSITNSIFSDYEPWMTPYISERSHSLQKAL